MDNDKFLRLIKRNEDPKLDFKIEPCFSTEGGKKEFARDVAAMANSRGGRGYIIFGIEDKTKKLVGIDPQDFIEEQIQQILNSRIDPPVTVSIEMYKMNDLNFAILNIFTSSHKPHQVIQNGSFYVRRGSTTDTARRSEIAGMLQENGLVSYETIVLSGAVMEDLDMELIKSYLSGIGVLVEKPGDILLEAMGFIGENPRMQGYSPTIGGLLLFGKDPWHYLPHVYIKVEDDHDCKVFYGNILKMLDDSLEYINKRINDPSYPIRGIEEILANAVVHRDYFDTSRGINVYMYDGKIEICNPGALFSGNSLYKNTSNNNPGRRNPWLYQRLITADSKKRFMRLGTGMKRVKEAYKGIGEVKYVNLGTQNLFKVILPAVL